MRRHRAASHSVAVCLLAALASLSFLPALILPADAVAAAAGGSADQGGDRSSGFRRAGLGGRQRGAFGRLSQPTPQQHRQWHSNAGRLVPAAEVPAAGGTGAGIRHTRNGLPAASAAAAATSATQESRRRLQQHPQNNGAAADSSSNNSVNDADSSSGSDSSSTVSFCPAWSASAATQAGQVELPADRQGSSGSSRAVNFTADFNAYASGGATAADRLSIIAVAAADAVNAALGNSSGGNGSAVAAAAAAAASDIAVAPGLFDPLTVDELLAVYQFLYDQPDLNLTLIETATNNDNFVAWIELAPHNKQAALKWLDSQPPGSTSGGTSASSEPVGQMPARHALALVLQGRHDPPRVVRLRVGPLPQPTSWSYEPLGPAGQLEAGWLQRPYSIQEASAVGTLVDAAMARLGPVLRAHLDGYLYSPVGNCTNKCLTYSMGAPFGSGPSQPPGTVINPPRRGASNSNTNSDSNSNAGDDNKGSVAQRWLWAFFYRDLEGHHLHTVGLELQIDAAAFYPADWSVKQVWFADRMWASVDALLAAHNASTPGGRSSGGNSAAGAEDLAKFHMHPITASDAVFSTFVPRSLGDADGSASTSALPGAKPGSGPPLQFEPGGRRFKLSGYAVEDWMGWSFSIGHQPTTGINFWDIRFRGERIIWELSLQEAYAAYGGASPMQSHVQYLDSHFGLGSAYKELVAGVDCPLNAAFLDLSLVFMSGPLIVPNAVCIFEVSTGRPLLRHFADAGGGPAYYGAVTDTTLVVRGISTIYNYDYVEDLVLHLDGSLQVAVHTTGYPQSAWFSWERHGNKYGYPLWYDNGGTIHDHQLNWKVDMDIAGTSNSVRFDQVLAREIQPDNGFPGSSVPWYSKRLQQVIPEREAEAALFWNGSSKAHPERRAPVALQFIINEDAKNKWGSARGYRIQHTQATSQVLPDNFTATAAFSWTFYQTAVTRREESEPSSSSQLNQALPFAPALDFQTQLLATAASQARSNNNNNSSKQGDSSKSGSGSQLDLGDPIRRQDLVLWVTSGLQHVPGAEDAPVTPTTGPAIGFWLRPFNFFDESAAASQPDLVYIPALTRADAQAAADAAAEDGANATAFSLAPVIGRRIRGNASAGGGSGAGARGAVSSALPVVGRDAVEVVTLRDREGLLAARRGVQPYIGVALAQTCIPSFAVTPFNGTYTQLASGTSSNSGNASGAAAAAGGNSGGNATAGSGGGGGSTGRASSSGGGATQGSN